MTDAKHFRATVDQIERDTVVLDVEGTPLRVPRALLPGDVREGAGFEITITAAPDVAADLKRSVEERLRALTSGTKPPGGSTPPQT